MSPVHRDADGGRRAAGTWRSLVEQLIEEAQERGDFDDLPLRGQPLPRVDDTYAGEMRLGFTVLRTAGVAPPWIEADKEVRRLRAERDRLLERAAGASDVARAWYRKELIRIVEAHARAVAAVNAEAPGAVTHRRRMRLDDELAAFDRQSEVRTMDRPSDDAMGPADADASGAERSEERSLDPGETWGQGPDASHPESATDQELPLTDDDVATER